MMKKLVFSVAVMGMMVAGLTVAIAQDVQTNATMVADSDKDGGIIWGE